LDTSLKFEHVGSSYSISGRTIAITGASGSFGSSLARHLLRTTTHKLRLLGRSESRLQSLQLELGNSPRLTYILCDIRDPDRLSTAFDGADEIYHAAAAKIVGQSYVHTREFVKTNVLGTMNVIDAARHAKVERVLFISSDKQTEAINPYGATKKLGEDLISEANMQVPHTTRFASVRGGNVWGSRGSVVERWLKSDTLNVTNPDITRVHVSMQAWLEFCVNAMSAIRGGETFVPKLRAWRLGTLAEAFLEQFPEKVIVSGTPQDGDKTHEVLISRHELHNTVDINWAYVVQPSRFIRDVWQYEERQGYPVTQEVGSDTAAKMGVDELRTAIVKGD